MRTVGVRDEGSVAELLRRNFGSISPDTIDTSEILTVRGLVTSRREISKRLVFVDITESGFVSETMLPVVQVALRYDVVATSPVNEWIVRRTGMPGDEVVITGHPGRTRTGAVNGGASIFALTVTPIALTLPSPRLLTILHTAASHEDPPIAELARSLCGVPLPHLPALLTLLAPQLAEHAASVERSRANNTPKTRNHTPTRPSLCRRARFQDVANGRQRGLFVVLENPGNPANVAAIMRSCDAFGATEVILVISEPDTAITIEPRAPSIMSVSASASCWVAFKTVPSWAAAIDRMVHQSEERMPTMYATTLHSPESTPLYQAQFVESGGVQSDPVNPVAVLLGNEARGLSAEAQALAHTHLSIPMRGMVESLNLSVAAAVVLSEVTRQRHASGREFGLTTRDRERVLETLEQISTE